MLPIYLYGHPVLRKVSEPITAEYPKLNELIDKMWDSMYESEGIGLAAPQIGKSIRLMVIDADALKDYYPECADFKRVFINAQIIESSNDQCSETEGCLSVPGINEKVERPVSVTICYQDEHFNEHEETLTDFRARVFQHEYDHIEGKLFVDHVSPLRKRMIKGKLQSISKGKVRAHYPIVPANGR